jgi:hypothetical protein
VQRTKIVSIDNDTLRGAYNVISIGLSQNFIGDIQVGAFVDQAKLTRLYLSRNRLKKLIVGTFDPLVNIQKIYLSGNQITILEDETFVKNLYLKEVNLNQNKIFAIGTKAFSWENLNRLELKNNMCVNWEFIFLLSDRINSLSSKTYCFDIYESHKKSLGND